MWTIGVEGPYGSPYAMGAGEGEGEGGFLQCGSHHVPLRPLTPDQCGLGMNCFDRLNNARVNPVFLVQVVPMQSIGQLSTAG